MTRVARALMNLLNFATPMMLNPERPHRRGDTGAYLTGRLTCLVLEADTRRFLHT